MASCCDDQGNCSAGCCGDEVKPAVLTGFEGWYTFAYPGGEFQVCLRPGGGLFCPEYQEQATWAVSGAKGAEDMAIDFKRYGTYMLKVTGAGVLDGASTVDANDWRKMKYGRAFTPVELVLMGKAGMFRSSNNQIIFHRGEDPTPELSDHSLLLHSFFLRTRVGLDVPVRRWRVRGPVQARWLQPLQLSVIPCRECTRSEEVHAL